ncbi:hypothetical protein KM043_016773 [Ampulex compressa]|nr:hypothetical protein KM043_016773 [Ampulex compressa]
MPSRFLDAPLAYRTGWMEEGRGEGWVGAWARGGEPPKGWLSWRHNESAVILAPHTYGESHIVLIDNLAPTRHLLSIRNEKKLEIRSTGRGPTLLAIVVNDGFVFVLAFVEVDGDYPGKSSGKSAL